MGHQYVHLDTNRLDTLPDKGRYEQAGEAIKQARQVVSEAAAYRDAHVAAMVAARPERGGQSEVARILGAHRNAISTHLKNHKERAMPQVVPQSEDITSTPALTYLNSHGTLHVTAVGKAGLLAQISIDLGRDHSEHEILEQITAEITPWLPVLDALRVEDQAREIAIMVDREVRWYGQAEDVADEKDRRAQLVGMVHRYQTTADVASANRGMHPRLDESGREIALPLRTADAIVDRLNGVADQAHRRAVDAAPGEVPELLLWTTPKPLHGEGEPLAEWLKSRLS